MIFPCSQQLSPGGLDRPELVSQEKKKEKGPRQVKAHPSQVTMFGKPDTVV